MSLHRNLKVNRKSRNQNRSLTQRSSVKRVRPYPSVWRQGEGPDGGFQLFLGSGGVAAVAVGDRPDLDVELLGLFIVKVRVAGVEVVLLLPRAAWSQRSRRMPADRQLSFFLLL